MISYLACQGCGVNALTDWLSLAPLAALNPSTLKYILIPLLHIIKNLGYIVFDFEIARRKHRGRHHGRFTLPSALGCSESGDGELAPPPRYSCFRRRCLTISTH